MVHPQPYSQALPASTCVISVAREHIRLSYEYLNCGDLEGYASLVDPEARFRPLNTHVSRGPQEAAELLLTPDSRPTNHIVHKIIVDGDGDGAAVAGTLTLANSKCREFVDLLSISDHGLLLSWRRFLAKE